MKRFIIRTSLFIIYFLATALVTLLLTGFLAKNKLANRGRGAVIDKNTRLDSLKKPKLILVGGSNVCYGINSQLLQDSLQMEVVDMAINANMGMLFYYEQVKHAVNAGDIVIGIPEYAAYTGESTLGDAGMYSLALIDNRNYKFIQAKQWLRLPIFMGDLISTNIKTMFTSGDNKITMGRYQYNIFGDFEGHKNEPSQSNSFKNDSTANLKLLFNKSGVNEDFIALIKSFNNFCVERKALYLHSYPVYAKDFFDSSITQKISQALQPIRFMNKPETYLYPFDSLYDSPNHILYNNRNERTLKLIQDIKQAVQQYK